MKQEIIVKFANVCGRDCYYPHNESAELVLSMCRSGRGVRKVFVKDDLEKLEKLGHEVRILHPRLVYETE